MRSVTQSCLTLSDPMDCSRQAPLSMEFSRQEYWGGLPFPPSGDLPNPGIEPESLESTLAGRVFTTWGAHIFVPVQTKSLAFLI